MLLPSASKRSGLMLNGRFDGAAVRKRTKRRTPGRRRIIRRFLGRPRPRGDSWRGWPARAPQAEACTRARRGREAPGGAAARCPFRAAISVSVREKYWEYTAGERTQQQPRTRRHPIFRRRQLLSCPKPATARQYLPKAKASVQPLTVFFCATDRIEASITRICQRKKTPACKANTTAWYVAVE